MQPELMSHSTYIAGANYSFSHDATYFLPTGDSRSLILVIVNSLPMQGFVLVWGLTGFTHDVTITGVDMSSCLALS